MANTTNLKGTDKLREAYPIINQNVAALNLELGKTGSDIDLLFGTSVKNENLTRDVNGNVTGFQATNDSGTLTSASWTFNGDGTLNTVTEVIGTETITSTMNYTNGQLTSVSRVIS